jgi:small-conductance mechanosensitive channel
MALYITGMWPDLLDFLNDTVVPLGRNKISLEAILQGAVSVAVLLMLALWAGAALEERLMKMDGLHSSLRVVMARMGRAVLILVSVLVSLSLVGIDLTVLSVFGGALGVGLGLGLQKIASNYVSGFIILLDRSLTIGNMISVGSSSGRVTHINTRYTVLQGFDGGETIVPNEMLVSGVVLNSSLSNSMSSASATVSVGYESDVEQVQALMAAAAASVTRVSKIKPPSASLVNFGASGLDMKVGFWVDDVENGTGGVVNDVNLAIWKSFKKHGISIPFPQSEVRLIGVPAGAAAAAVAALAAAAPPGAGADTTVDRAPVDLGKQTR